MQQRAILSFDTDLRTAVHPVGERRGYARAKRAFDFVAAALLLIALSPVLLAAACLIALTSPGPVIYRQWRCGRGGVPFTFYKFRTMVDGAERRKADLLDQNEAGGPVFKLRNDPRRTPLGRWLRKLSIDELPQLFNVLRGEMSLVGPRPPLPEEVAQYGPREWRRLAVKPGLTCLWQVSGRSNIGFREWVELDLDYIERRSFAYDLWLLALTVPAVITGRGAV